MLCRAVLYFCVPWLAGCDRATSLRYEEPHEKLRTVADLKALCPAGGTRIIARDIDLRCVVTANDLFGELHKTLVVEDATGGIEISIDRERLYLLFPLDSEVALSCNGLAVGDYGGKAVLGAPPTGPYTVDRIAAADLGRYIRMTDPDCERRHAEVRTFADLTLRDADRYVRFDGVHFARPGVKWCATDPASFEPLPTEHTLCDAAGRTLPVRVAPGSMYATEPVPRGTGSVGGIVDYFNGRFALRIVNREFDFTPAATSPTAGLSAAGY